MTCIGTIPSLELRTRALLSASGGAAILRGGPARECCWSSEVRADAAGRDSSLAVAVEGVAQVNGAGETVQ